MTKTPQSNGSSNKGVVEIDVSRLDEEWIKQPERYLEYAEELAEAKYQLDSAKAKLDVTEAEVELDIRQNPDKYGIEGTAREGMYKIQIALHEDVRAATEVLNKKKYRVEVLSARVRAMEHKKASLENLVILQGQGYFAKPREPKGSDYDKRTVRNRGK